MREDSIKVFIEISKGSTSAYELDKETGQLKVKRPLPPGLSYPYNYGFTPNTLSGDGDELDIIVLSEQPIEQNTTIKARPIGMLDEKDQSGPDPKIIAVQTSLSNEFSNLNDIADLSDKFKQDIITFIQAVKQAEPGKWVQFNGWKSREEAFEELLQSTNRFESHKI